MSEFTTNRDHRLSKLLELSDLILGTGNASDFIRENKEFIGTAVPSDFIYLFDELIGQGHPIENLKVLSNKVLNIFHHTIEAFECIPPEPDSFLGIMTRNNQEMEQILNSIRSVYKSFLKQPEDEKIRKQLILSFERLEKFSAYYVIKENVLFPAIENILAEHRCLKIMWSFHDDIRKNIKGVAEQLKGRVEDQQVFNRNMGDVFFKMLAIKFREEHILFPYLLSALDGEELAYLNQQAAELGYPYFQPGGTPVHTLKSSANPELVDLLTGALSPEQIILIFNHLPLDITYVDEHDKVRFFSSPEHRIFPRTNAIIGRDVHNCHPPESIHVVEKIIQSFRNGEKDQASFWIKMKDQYILIQYFALRNESGSYRGVLELTQEISDIKKLEGERRLLDW